MNTTPIPDPDRDPEDGEELRAGDPRVRVLPQPEEVFVADQQWLARALHPLLTVDLASLDPAWSGSAPILSPVEPVEGLLGDETTDAHDEFAGENWITLRREAGLWRFLGRRDYFEIERADAGAELLDHYAEAEAQLAGTRVRWERDGALTWGDTSDPTQTREGWRGDLALVDQFGGEPGWGNWASYGPLPSLTLDESDPASPVLRLSDGRPFRFVAQTSGYPWREQGADAIVVFFEPETETLALTFDWS